MPYGFQILSEEPQNQFGDNYVLNRGQMLTEVKCSKVCFAIRSLGLKHHQAIKMVTALKRMLPPNFARALAKGTVMSCFCFVLSCFVCLFVCFHVLCFVLFFCLLNEYRVSRPTPQNDLFLLFFFCTRMIYKLESK